MTQQTFNKAGKSYDDYAEPQRWAASHLTAKIPDDHPPAHILELGCGTGLLTHSLRERFPSAIITAVDAAPGMVETARLRPGLGDVQWFVQDMTRADIPGDVDLIVSGCTLHWLDDLPEFLSNLRSSVKAGTPLHFSIMLKGTVAEVQDARRQALPQHEPPEELPGLSEILAHCTTTGWVVDYHEELPFCTRFTSAWELLQSLQRTGVTGGRFGTKDRPLYRGDLRRLMNELTRIYGQHRDGIPLHYQVGFISCRAEGSDRMRTSNIEQ